MSPIAKTVGTIGFDDETVNKNAEDWGAKARLLSFIENWLTLIGLAIGVILAGLGGYLLLTPRSSEDDAYATALRRSTGGCAPAELSEARLRPGGPPRGSPSPAAAGRAAATTRPTSPRCGPATPARRGR